MSKQRSVSIVATAQDIGGADVQREWVRAGPAQTADGSRLLLSVVAAASDSGKSAERVVEQVFQAVSGSQANNLSNALKRGLEIASQGLARQGAAVSASAVALRKGRIYFASIGDTVVIRVAGQEAIRLTHPSSSRLGSQDEPQIQSGPAVGHSLQRGDRVVIASGGILETSPADGKPYVDPGTIPEHIRNLPAEDAAKLLMSIALGRDVGRNVSIAVLGEAKESRSMSRAALVIAGAVAAMVIVVAGLVLLQPSDTTPSTTDYGFAVLVRGGVLASIGDEVPFLVGNLDTIPAGTNVSAQTDAALGLQSTFGENTDLTRGNIYLVQGSDLWLDEIDIRGNTGGSGATRLELGQGSVLVSRQSGTWEYRVQTIGNEAILTGAGKGVMGLETSGRIVFDCLIGICRFVTDVAGESLINGGKRLTIGISSGIANESEIPPDAIARWNEICGGCVP